MASAEPLRQGVVRRWLAAALLCLLAIPAQAQAQVFDLTKVRRGATLEVIYLGTPDCPYCQHWESRAKGELLASPLAASFRFHEVIGRTLRQPIMEQHYPEELRWLSDKLGPSRGVPRFLLTADRMIIASVFGTNAYESQFLPALREAVARRNAGA